MANKKIETPAEKKPDMVKVRGLRSEDVAVIVNGECRVIPMGREIEVEKRFADEFERSERAKDEYFRKSLTMEKTDL